MTVLIVDDETYMVEYMKNLVDWKACGFDQVLTAKGEGLPGICLQSIVRSF